MERANLDKEREDHGRVLEAHGIGSEEEIARRLQEQAQKEKDDRVAQLHRMASRRIAKQDLSRGFNGWQEIAAHRRHCFFLLQRAAARISKPRLAGAFFEW